MRITRRHFCQSSLLAGAALAAAQIPELVSPVAAQGQTTTDPVDAAKAESLLAERMLLPGERLTWGEEPVEEISPTRSEIVLNGLWLFQPGLPDARDPSPANWGLIRVPGSWRTGYTSIAIPGIVAPGAGPGWDSWRQDTLNFGWYERPLQVPASWQGRAILLDLTRVSTDAWIYVDGRETGRVRWPGGEVDLTRFVTPGHEHQLRIVVAAMGDQQQAEAFPGPGAGPVPSGDAKIESKGLINNVILLSRPQGPHISDVFVQPSTRRKQVTLSIELSGVEKPGPVRLTGRMERNGKVEKTFQGVIVAQAAPLQTLKVTWRWPDPALWDLDQPNLYVLKLSANGAGLNDTYAQPFGFREVWVEGRKIFLNGVEIRLRPQIVPEEYTGMSGTRELIEGSLKGLRLAGHNSAEMWPSEAQRRGQQHFHEEIYDVADRLGFPLMGSAGSMNAFIGWGQDHWKSPAARAEWERLTRLELRRYRRHPSILIWTSSGNIFDEENDQHPQALGRDNWYTNQGLIQYAAVISSGLAFMRDMDPTRPAYIHQSILGDLYAVNNYLDFTPLQEREEWLSAWSQNGKKPYLAVEFGTPLSTSFMRGRENYEQAQVSEPWVTEFAAIYLGPESYRMETPGYRAAIHDHFQKDQLYNNWGGASQIHFAPATQAIEELFIRNTWRSWRTWGITGGMVPWETAYGWETPQPVQVKAPPFQPGRRGTYTPALSKEMLFWLRPEGGSKIQPAGQALIDNNGSTLAYIAGGPDAFTDKQHAYRAGRTVHKQVVILNDERTPQRYSFTWHATVGGKRVASGSKSGVLAPAGSLLAPISFKAPTSADKTDGVIQLSATIGPAHHTDSLSLRVFPIPAPEAGTITVFDPVGKTTAMLKELGFTVQQWTGHLSAGLLVVGRDALSGDAVMPGSLDAVVQGGGRVLCFAQQPADMVRLWGLRVSRNVSARVFPVSAAHPVLAGLDSIDLSDWAGASDLLPAHTPLPDNNVAPPYGWHWGNRGGVTSAAVEKPHLSGWRPILECEFDGAYSPLMELDYGKGRMTLCLLDLEGRTTQEPAADLLARSILRYARTAPLHPRASHTAILGTAPAWLGLLGLQAEPVQTIPANADLLIVAPNAPVDDAPLQEYVERGGRVVFLPHQSNMAPLGLVLEQGASAGSLEAPDWSIAAGLSPSDLRWRTETTAWLATAGADIGAGGQLAMKQIGKGLAVWLQLDPDRFEADRQTFFRFTRWRQTRAIVQVLANLGATLRADSLALATSPPKPDRLALAGTWEIVYTHLSPGAPSADQPTSDPGFSDAAKQLVREGSHTKWQSVKVPQMFPEFEKMDGEAVVRRVVDVPGDWAGKDLTLSLGAVDDFDTTFWNGEPIGSTDSKIPNWWIAPRNYTVPGRLVKPGLNLLAVRIFDRYGGGGFPSQPEAMDIRLASPPPPGLYHPDYRTDFILGDDPFRYRRW